MPKAGDEYLPLADGSPGPSLACDQLRARIINGELSEAQWKRLLTAARIFKSRTDWPAGTPLIVQLHAPAWLGAAVEIRATARLSSAPVLRAGRTWSAGGGCGNVWSNMAKSEPVVDSPGDVAPVGTLAPDATGISFDVEIRTGLKSVEPPTAESLERRRMSIGGSDSVSWTFWDNARVLHKTQVTLPVTQLSPAEFQSRFAATPKLDPASFLQTTVHPHSWADGKSRGYLALWWKPAPADASMAIGITADLLRDGKVIESKIIRSDSWIASTDNALLPREDVIFDSLLDALKAPGGLQNQPAELARYELLIRGDRAAAISSWKATSWWSGSIRVPLKDCLRSEGSFQPPGKELPLR
jgi:hypothetical protein